MKQFVSGIALSEDYSQVVMLHKNRPENLAGKLNFPGGKVENHYPWYEYPDEAIEREFAEETGVRIEEWDLISYFKGEGFVIYCYKTVTDKIYKCRTMTDEKIELFPTSHILDERMLRDKYYPSLLLNQPNSIMLSLALQKQIRYPVTFYWNGVRDNQQLGL